MAQQKIEFKHFNWINISDPDKQTTEKLLTEFPFHPLEIEDSLTVSFRSKVDIHDNYMFIVLLFPVFNRETREIEAAELNIFVSGSYVVTIHNGNLDAFNNFLELFRISSEARQRFTDKSPEALVYEMLNRMYLYVLPMIDHLADDCDTIENAIFHGRERQMISQILHIRRNITAVRKIMQIHKNVLKKTIGEFKNNKGYVLKKTDAYYQTLVDYTKEIWDVLDNLKERIEALQETNESQISFQISDIMRVLTVISFITFPATLLAAIFGMNAVNAMPFIMNPYGFWYIIGVMMLMIVAMVAVFKRKGWL